MKKLLLPFIAAALLAALLCATALAQPGAAAPAPLPAGTASPRDWSKYAPEGALLPEKIKGDSAILIDAKTGKVLFEKDADAKRYPASTTKIMTCLLALESGKSLDETVTVGTLPEADFASDSDNMGLKAGERITFGDLLAGMMVKSGNDAADAVAIHVGGSVENFVAMMNRRAQELGMTGTHYTCTNGLSNDTEHYTTPRDMTKLAAAAIKYPEFVKLVSSPSCTIGPTNKTTDPRQYPSTNKLLGDGLYGYAYATGIKTGYTSMAQNALISSAEKDGMTLIAADMHVDVRDNMWTDSVTMFEYGFGFYDTADLGGLLSNRTVPLEVKGAADGDPGAGRLELTLKPQGDAYVTDRREAVQSLKNDTSQLRQEVTVTKDAAPIRLGDTVGTVTYFYNGQPVLTCDLIAPRDVEAKAAPGSTSGPGPTNRQAGGETPAGSTSAGQTPERAPGAAPAFLWAALAVLLLALAALTIRIVNMQRKSRRYRQYGYRQGGGARAKH